MTDSSLSVLVATGIDVLIAEPHSGTIETARGLDGVAPTCLAVDPHDPARAWCGTGRAGVFRSVDGGRTWSPGGLDGRRVMSITASASRPGRVWVGTEPSQVWRTDDGGRSWGLTSDLERLGSAPTWAFPPRPETHHVRWIAADPSDADALWVAVEAGALVTTRDGGEHWVDRVEGSPHDTHEIAIHPSRPAHLRIAAGDGYYESADGGLRWSRPMEGLDVGYFRSVAVAPDRADVVVLSGASSPRSTYMAGSADGRVYRREGPGAWSRVAEGWPETPGTIAPLLRTTEGDGSIWAADERGLHRSDDHGRAFRQVIAFEPRPSNLRGLTLSR